MDEQEDLERQLEEHVVEQKESLAALQQALAEDPENQEISSLYDELLTAQKESEEALFHLKRARLLKEIDLLEATGNSEVAEEASSFVVGSKCRFKHIDGKWYNGKVIDLCNDGASARVIFLTPTDEKMQICRFYQQQRCRYGDRCRSSHGFSVQLSALKEFEQVRWEQIEIGCIVLACASDGLWQDAEVEKLVRQSQEVGVVFIKDGSRSNVGVDSLALSEHAAGSGEESSSSLDSDESDWEVSTAIGSIESSDYKAGKPQTETVTFANWEKHTRGIASKMMAKMGYRQGTGLGLSSQGLVAPLQIRILPPKTSLDFLSKAALHGNGSEDVKTTKKKSRGGKRKREKKFAEAARAVKQDEESRPDVFDFINVQLSGRGASSASSSKRLNSGAKKAATSVKEDRHSMIKQQDEIKELAKKVTKLEEMAQRNRKEKTVYEAVRRKLEEARKELTEAEAVHSSTVRMISNKEQEKRWLKF